MSKKKRTIRFKMTSNKPAFNAEDALRMVAQQYMKAEQKLAPLVAAQQMEPGAAVVLIACYAHAMVSGAQDTHKMTEDEIVGASNLLLKLWESKLFIPSKQFPYTFEEVQAAMQDDEDRGEE